MPTKRRVLIEAHKKEAVDRSDHGLPAASLEIDTNFDAVHITAREEHPEGTFLARGHVAHDEITALEDHPHVYRVWSDCEIGLFSARPGAAADNAPADAMPCPLPPCDCNYAQAKGTIEDVAAYIGVKTVWQAGTRGAGVAVGIVGGGITAKGRPISSADTQDPKWPGKLLPSVVNGWPEDWGTTGVALEWHGNAMATGVLGMAPEAELFDMRIVKATSETSQPGMISDAIAAYKWGLDQFRKTGKPQVLNNSWGILTEAAAQDYATDPDHPFTKMVETVIDAGMIVLFAAGNCGGTCPAPTCDQDVGPGRSIWGANGAPDVMCVVAANTLGEYVGYGGQGPAALDKKKPDFCAITHYKGYTDCDFGTSSACAIAAGVAALMKCAEPRAKQGQIKQSLERSAVQIGAAGWNPYSGHGVIRADTAVKALSKMQSARTAPLA